MNARLLLTGFDPFGGETVNPSAQVAQALDGERLGDDRVRAQVQSLVLPTVFGLALRQLNAAVDAALQSEAPPLLLVLALGQAGGRAELSLERVAINVDDARITDNAGAQPVDELVVATGPAAYFSTLPIKAMVAALHAAGHPGSISQSAGTFVCNHVFYGLQHRLQGTGVRSGFMHLPYVPQQARGKTGMPSVPLEQLIDGTRIALQAALLHEGADLRWSGGTVA